MLSDASVCLVFTVSSPIFFSPIDPETAADAPVIDYVDDDPSSLSAELLGKPLLGNVVISKKILHTQDHGDA